MVALIKKVKGRKTYYYAVRSARVDGKPRIVWQKYLGTLDAIVARCEQSTAPTPIETTLFEAGGVAALMQIANRIGLMEIINKIVPKRDQGPSVGHYILLAVGHYILLATLNRILDPLSKSQIGDWYQNTILRRLWGFQDDQFTSQRYWDHMGMISLADIETIQRLVVEKVQSEFKIETESLLYDCTNFFTFIDTHNERSTLAKRGKNKQKRIDLQQIGLALLTTRDFQIPLFHKTYRGNIPDVKIFPEVARDLLNKNKALSGNIKDSTLVFDKGNLSEDNRELLLHSGIYFVAGVKNDLIPDLLETPIEQFQEIIRSYRSLSNVEEAFKYMKNRDYLRWQPAFHWTDQKVEVHTFYCVLALLLATLARKAAVESGLDISLTGLLDDLSAIKEVALLYKTEKGVSARFTVNTMTSRQKKLADLFKIGEIVVQG